MDLREFRQLARDKSIDDVTKMRGGDLRYFDATARCAAASRTLSVPPAIAKAAFALKNTRRHRAQADQDRRRLQHRQADRLAARDLAQAGRGRGHDPRAPVARPAPASDRRVRGQAAKSSTSPRSTPT